MFNNIIIIYAILMHNKTIYVTEIYYKNSYCRKNDNNIENIIIKIIYIYILYYYIYILFYILIYIVDI